EASAGTSASGSSVRLTAKAAVAPRSRRPAPSPSRGRKRRTVMSEVLSGKEPGRQRQRRDGERRRGSEDSEGVELRETVRRVAAADEDDRRLEELGRLGKGPVQALDDAGRELGRDGGGDPVVRRQTRAEEEQRVGRHQRNARRRGHDADEERERE